MNIILLDNIAILDTSDCKELTDTCMRVSEFYESHKYKGNVQILKQDIINLYIEIGEGEEYYNVFEGYNFPKSTIEEFFTVNQPDEFEETLTNLPLPVTYVIGYITGDQQVLIHELAHAFYFSFNEYKQQADAITNSLSPMVRNILIKWLTKSGYDQQVHQDELQAYIVEDLLGDLIEDDLELHTVINNTCDQFNAFKQLFHKTLTAIKGQEVLGLSLTV
ncbi:MAG: hypothetical protein V4525_09910 [Pseudomonadota bacterium]